MSDINEKLLNDLINIFNKVDSKECSIDNCSQKRDIPYRKIGNEICNIHKLRYLLRMISNEEEWIPDE